MFFEFLKFSKIFNVNFKLSKARSFKVRCRGGGGGSGTKDFFAGTKEFLKGTAEGWEVGEI